MLRITLSREKIYSSGRKAISDFLLKLQIFKSTADYEKANALYEHYSSVDETFSKWRELVLLNKQPRLVMVQANTEIVGDKTQLRNYDSSSEGFINSWRERFGTDAKELQKIMLNAWEADRQHFQ